MEEPGVRRSLPMQATHTVANAMRSANKRHPIRSPTIKKEGKSRVSRVQLRWA